MMNKYFVLSFLVLLTACSGPQVQPPTGLSVQPSLEQEVAIMRDGYRLPYFAKLSEQLPDAVFVAVHGFNDYSNAFTGFCEYMAQHNKHCYAYDQRGFGRSQYTGVWPANGKLQSDLQTWSRLLKEKYPDVPLYVVGESMGGAVVMTTMQQYSLPDVAGYILFAPAVWGRTTQPWYQRAALWLTLRTFPGWKPTGKGIKRVASNNREALIANGRDPLFIKGTRVDAIYGLTNLMDAALAASKDNKVSAKNALLLYGANDQIIPKKPICQAVGHIHEQAHTWQFNHYQGGYHMLTRDLEAQDTFSDVLTWLDKPTANNRVMLDYCASKGE